MGENGEMSDPYGDIDAIMNASDSQYGLLKNVKSLTPGISDYSSNSYRGGCYENG